MTEKIMGSLVLKVVRYPDAIAAIQTIRQDVFQIEQQVASELDFDGMDEAATHIVAYCNSEPVGTARIRYLTDRLAKIERVAVLSAYRGQGIGKALMEKAIAFLDSQNITEIKLNAQVQVKDFYERLGFEQRGKAFEEAGILHVEMRRSHLNQANKQ